MFELGNIGVEIIPEGYGDSKSDVVDVNAKTTKKGARISAAALTEYGKEAHLSAATVHVDNDLAIEAFNRAKLIFEKLPLDEKKGTSHGYLATTIGQQLQLERNEAIAKSRASRSVTPKKKPTNTKRSFSLAPSTPPAIKPKRKKVSAAAPKVVEAEVVPSSRHVVRRSASPKPKVDNPFRCLGIKDLREEPIPADVTVILSYTFRNVPVEQVFTAHWVMIKEGDDNEILEADIVIDVRDETAELPPDIPFVDNATMEVSIWLTEDEETAFEAIRGMFRVEFGVFQILKFVAAYNG